MADPATFIPLDALKNGEWEGEQPDFVLYEMDTAAGLDAAVARRNADNLVRLATTFPKAKLSWAMPGFDSDPRELVDIPEAADFLGDMLRHMQQRDPEGQVFFRLSPEQRVVLLVAAEQVPRELLVIVQPKQRAAPAGSTIH